MKNFKFTFFDVCVCVLTFVVDIMFVNTKYKQNIFEYKNKSEIV